MTEINNRIEEVKKIAELIGKAECLFQDGSYPCPEGEGINGSNICDYCKAHQIYQLFPQPLDDKELREKIGGELGYALYCDYDLNLSDKEKIELADVALALLPPKIEEEKIKPLQKYVAYILTFLATVGIVGYLVRLGGGDFSKGIEFLKDTWWVWLIYATSCFGGYALWYYRIRPYLRKRKGRQALKGGG